MKTFARVLGLAAVMAAGLVSGTSTFADDDIRPPDSPPPGNDTFVATWKQLVAAREEVAQLRKEAEANALAIAGVRELERQCAVTRAELAACRQQVEAAQAETLRLQQQAATLQERAASIPALEARLRQTQEDVRSQAQSLIKAQTDNEVLVRAKALMLENRVQEQLDIDAARRSAEAQLLLLRQENEALAKAVAAAEVKSRQELATLQADLAAKDEALAEAERLMQQTKTEAAKSAARITELEQQQAQEKDQANAKVQELQRTLEAEQARATSQGNEALAKATADAQTQSQPVIAALQADLAAKDEALAEAGRQAQHLQVEAEKMNSRITELEQLQAQADAKVHKLEKRLDAKKTRAASQENKAQAKALADAEAKSRQELAELQVDLAAKDKALGDAELQRQSLAAEAEKSAARLAEIEQQRTQEQAQADANAQELQNSLEAEKTRSASLESEISKFSTKIQSLEKSLKAATARATSSAKEPSQPDLQEPGQTTAPSADTEPPEDLRQMMMEDHADTSGPSAVEPPQKLDAEKAKIAKKLDALEKKWSAKIHVYQDRLNQEKERSLQRAQELEKQIEAEAHRSTVLEQEKSQQAEELQQLRQKIADALEKAQQKTP